MLNYPTIKEHLKDDLAKRFLDAIDFVNKNIRFVASNKKGKGFRFEEANNLKTIKDCLVYLIASPDCEKQFINAKLPILTEVIKRRGLTFAASGVIIDKELCNKYLPSINENNRQIAIKDGINKIENQAFTLNSDGVGMIYTIVKDSAFSGASYLTGTYDTYEIVVHEMIHVVGKGIHPYKIFNKQIGHDLKGYEHYSDILNACKLQ